MSPDRVLELKAEAKLVKESSGCKLSAALESLAYPAGNAGHQAYA